MSNIVNELTPDNFIGMIQTMAERERNKIPAKKLIELICQMTEPTNVQQDVPAMSTQMDELRQAIQHITQMATVNKTEISTLKIENSQHITKNAALKAEIDLLKVHARECLQHRQDNPPAPPPQPTQNAEIERLREDITAIQVEINDIQQYLRVNNLEVVGLPAPNDGESEEKLLLNALNELEGLEEPIRSEDIDISHPLNSKRKDGKNVHVVRFVHRKTKFSILAAKKRDQNKQFQFRQNDVYVNEHLSKQNRGLFAAAQDKKRALKYKYCWTRGGVVYLRKTDDSDVISISCIDDLNDLQ